MPLLWLFIFKNLFLTEVKLYHMCFFLFSPHSSLCIWRSFYDIYDRIIFCYSQTTVYFIVLHLWAFRMFSNVCYWNNEHLSRVHMISLEEVPRGGMVHIAWKVVTWYFCKKTQQWFSVVGQLVIGLCKINFSDSCHTSWCLALLIMPKCLRTLRIALEGAASWVTKNSSSGCDPSRVLSWLCHISDMDPGTMQGLWAKLPRFLTSWSFWMIKWIV